MDTETHTLVLIFPADVIREVDARRQGRSRIEVIAEAIEATRMQGTAPRLPADLSELLG
jgi:hypothetical protein